MGRILVIGGGAAGMFAAIAAGAGGSTVTLLEKNERLGKKLFITGKGRCNLTNAGNMETLLENIVTNPKFLYSALSKYNNQRVIDFFESHGLSTKVERGNRVFPASDHSSDVIAVLQRALQESRVDVQLNTEVEALLLSHGNMQIHVTGVRLANGSVLSADRIILATGGFSYQSTGSTGDGYRFAKEAGHTVTEICPSLVPLCAKEPYVASLQGLSLKNVQVRIRGEGRILYEAFGEMLFTHYGVSGPLILSASAVVGPELLKKELAMEIDLKPALSEEQLDARLLREFEEAQNKQFKNVIGSLFPAKLVPVMLSLGGIDPEKRINSITREERAGFIRLMKAFPVTLTGLRDFDEAVITHGGVAVREVNPSTMESMRVKGLYFCGELLDVDAMTGGFNLQIAWSTGHLAGVSANAVDVRKEEEREENPI